MKNLFAIPGKYRPENYCVFFWSTKWLAAKLKAVDLQRLFFVASFSYCQLKASCTQPTVKSFFFLSGSGQFENESGDSQAGNRCTSSQRIFPGSPFSKHAPRRRCAKMSASARKRPYHFRDATNWGGESRTRNRLREKLKGNHAYRNARV